MASIDKATLAAYRQTLDKVCSEAGATAVRALEEWLGSHPGASIEECREAAISIADAVLELYGDASSSLACNLFDSVMEAEGVAVPAAQMYEGVREGAVEGTVRRVVGNVDGSQVSLDAFTQAVGQLVERETRLAASTTVEENVERVAKTKEGRDVRYARVPTSAVPCKWCAMLASRGFVYRKAESAEAASHHHCTCTIVPGVEGMTDVAGYDPDHYYDVWKNREKYELVDELDRRADGSIAASSNYFMQDDLLYSRMKLMKPEPGYEEYYDVGMHSNGISFSNGHIGHNWELADEVEYTVKELADLIRMDKDWDGGPIRLVACWAGEYPDGAAKQLADELGVKVLAPNMEVYVDFDGQYRLARNRLENKMIIKGEVPETGSWLLFEPKEVG